jgi:hypothetical protein
MCCKDIAQRDEKRLFWQMKQKTRPKISVYIANIINLFTWHAFTMVDRITSK